VKEWRLVRGIEIRKKSAKRERERERARERERNEKKRKDTIMEYF